MSRINLYVARSELEQLKRERDLATAQLLMVGSEINGDPKMDPMDYRDPRWTPTLEEAAKLRAEAERMREVLVTVTANLVAAKSLLEGGGKKAAASDRMFEQMLIDYQKAIDVARAVLGYEGEGEEE